MNTINNWSRSKKLTLVAIWVLATVGRVAYVSLDVPGEAITMFTVTALVLASMFGLFRAYTVVAQRVIVR